MIIEGVWDYEGLGTVPFRCLDNEVKEIFHSHHCRVQKNGKPSSGSMF